MQSPPTIKEKVLKAQASFRKFVQEMIDRPRTQADIDLENYLTGLDPENQKIEQHLKRVENCGRPAKVYDFDNGGYRTQRFICGDWRVCDYCKSRRIELLRDRYILARSQLNGALVVIQITDRQWSSLRRKAQGKHWYLKAPVGDDTNIIFIDSNALDTSLDKYNHIDPNDLDWETVISTPKGKRYSGDLGKVKEKPKPVEPTVTIEHPLVMFDFSKVTDPITILEHQAEQYALEYTAQCGLPGFDKRQIEQALAQCMYLYCEYMRKHGAKVDYRITVKNKVSVTQYKRSISDKLTNIAREHIKRTVPTKLGQDILFAIRGIPAD